MTAEYRVLISFRSPLGLCSSRYRPKGNMLGEFKTNVATKSGRAVAGGGGGGGDPPAVMMMQMRKQQMEEEAERRRRKRRRRRRK